MRSHELSGRQPAGLELQQDQVGDVSPVSAATLRNEADTQSLAALKRVVPVVSQTFAGVNGIFGSDELHPGSDLPMRIYATKTTLTETVSDDK